MFERLDHLDPKEVPYESITENLEFVLHDQVILKAGNRIELYCDASDVQRAILGMRAYFLEDPDNKTSRLDVNLSEFRKASSLVAALLAHGSLGSFRLLPPHQAEFLRNLDNFTYYDNWDPRAEEALRESFLDSVGLTTSTKRPGIAQLSPKQLDDYVERYLGGTQQFFRSLQCISHTWWERLEEWTKRSLLCTRVIAWDYSAVAEKPSFSKVMDLFEELRPRHTDINGVEQERKTELNSFVDAAVLLMLCEMSQKAKKEKRMCRFYDSTGLFRRVAERAGLTESLLVSVPQDEARMTPVLVGSRYLIYRAAVTHHTKKNGRGGVVSSLDEKDVKLLEKEVHEFSDGRERLPIEKLDEILVAKRWRLGPVLGKLINCSFFDHIWQPQLAAEEIQQLRDRLALSKRDLDSKAFREKYQQIVSNTRTAFQRNAAEVGRLRSIWLDAEEALSPLKQEVDNERLNEAKSFSPVRDLDIVRFDLPPDVQGFVEKFIDELVKLGDDYQRITRRPVWREFVLACHEGRNNPQHSLGAATLLWLMGATASLVKHFNWVIRSEATPTLRVMYAAALLNTRTDVNTAARITNGLQEDYQISCKSLPTTTIKVREHLGLASELAYLHFHQWLATGATPYWRGVDVLPPYPKEDELILLDKAIEFADYAFECLIALMVTLGSTDEELNSKRTYILNQRLYYRVEQGNPMRLREMREVRKVLMESENPPLHWDYTYYDTVARFYEFEGVTSTSAQTCKKCFDRALDRAQMAVYAAPSRVRTEKHRTVRDYLDHIVAESTRRFG